ncbi:citrate synthase [Zavarzinia compransoris]|uniref:citrate synthase (unknown stereospecificity) n=1 Tax=Zavarzinia compransoris TaxID=1264899 RepID=A0A317EDJ9_9PROT|nr:citrate synthase [Zavarzinia compransoris]PWR23433.1 citrate synthase [Zavarzinia compransoris]TDP45990.1 citrate synthase [Zavarzinia compransoris]
MDEWIDRAEALALLNVKAQTLYAYVSRGLIQVRPDPAHVRRSLYRAEDVAALGRRRTRSRKPAAIAAGSMAWGEPSITTSLSTVQHGRLIYRGQDAARLGDGASLEQVAALLWDIAAEPVFIPAPGAGPPGPPFAALAALVPDSRSSAGRGADRLARDAQAAIGALAAACGLGDGPVPLHRRLAAHWRIGGDGADLLRRALVLLADHELNASTFAARVAASTGAPLAACLLAGLCALSGPRHGGAAGALARLLAEAERTGAAAAVDGWLDRHGGTLPGFGHPLYPGGDIRAHSLLARLEPDAPPARLAAAVLAATGQRPNIDYALMVLARTLALPEDAPFVLFLLGRSVGWAAHAMEQAKDHAIIRPRAVYAGAPIKV